MAQRSSNGGEVNTRAVGRRSFLQAGVGLGIGVGVGVGSLAARPSIARARTTRYGADSGRAKNLIFMVSDGMSFGTLTIADTVMRVREGHGSAWCGLWEKQGVRRSMQMTPCADAFVTDSAAAAAGWGCGQACNTGVLNIDPDGKQYLPLLVHARQNGKATGVVTTARVTHATPAGFCANVPHRDLEDDIARQQLERGIDVILGGGARHFSDELIARHPAWKVARTRDELAKVAADAAANEGRMLGLFGREHVAHVLDRGPEVPSLEEMAMAALGRLDKAPEGFVLQIEGGRVDHAAHDNDAASLVYEQLEFDRTLAKVLAWLEGRDDTMLVVTADHSTANPGLTLYGKRGEKALEKLMLAKHSFEWMFEKISDAKKSSTDLGKSLSEIVEEGTGVVLDEESHAIMMRRLSSKRVMPFRDANTSTSVLGAILASTFGVSFVSPNHTSDMVELTSFGPGSEKMRPVMRNRDVWNVVTDALGFAPCKLLDGMDQIVQLKRVEGD